jgi:hypothetical protein
MNNEKRLSFGLISFLVCLLILGAGTVYGNGRDGSSQAKSMLEITYDNMAKQVVPLEQPSGNIQSMTFRGGQSRMAQTGQAPLSHGWDIFDRPLSFGQVSWSIPEGGKTNNMEVAVHLSGAIPNHEFTVGVHLFNASNTSARPDVTGFGGWFVGSEGMISRDGRSAYQIAYDFGGLKTNASGDGSARFNLTVPPGTYHLQYTVRIGAVNTCRTNQGIYSGCSIVYRTGNKYGEKLETITIAQ